MGTVVFGIILKPREWKTLEALNAIGETQSPAVHNKVSDVGTERARTHQILGRLAVYGLVIRTEKSVSGPFGLVHQVFWEVSPEGRRLFFS
jgi:hypothetical protein